MSRYFHVFLVGSLAAAGGGRLPRRALWDKDYQSQVESLNTSDVAQLANWEWGPGEDANATHITVLMRGQSSRIDCNTRSDKLAGKLFIHIFRVIMSSY